MKKKATMLMARSLITVLVLFLQSPFGVAKTTPQLRRDPQVQTQIAAVVGAVVREKDNTLQRLEQLQESAGTHRSTLLQQLALYLSQSQSTEASMGGALILRQLAFTPDEKMAAVLPYLESGNASLDKILAEILATVDRPSGGEPDFTLYEHRILKLGTASEAHLIRYMYQVSPDAALASMRRLQPTANLSPPNTRKLGQLQTVLARHRALEPWSGSERRRAQATLDGWSRSAHWWLRLYVAAVLKQQPLLATPEILIRLRADPDSSVSGFMAP